MNEYSNLTNAELRKALADRGINITGSKEKLIEALQADDTKKASSDPAAAPASAGSETAAASEEGSASSEEESAESGSSEEDPTALVQGGAEGDAALTTDPEAAQSAEKSEETETSADKTQEEAIADAVKKGLLVVKLTNGAAVIHGPDSEEERNQAERSYGSQLASFANGKLPGDDAEEA